MSDQKKILVVDDDPDLVEAITMVLENEKFSVEKAYDGVQAWEKIKEDKPDLMVLDVMMPKKDGYELCEEVKSDPQYKDITIVLLTAVGSAVTTTNYTHRGGRTTLANEYIPKPIDLDKLLVIVKDYINVS